MRTSLCCRARVATHGARRRVCVFCGGTWTVRPRRRGRPMKRTRPSIARLVLEAGTSLRGLSDLRGINRETIRKRFHRGLVSWLVLHPPALIPPKVSLVAVIDAFWIKHGPRHIPYGCFIVLLRPISGDRAYLALSCLSKGKEGRLAWERVCNRLPRDIQQRIVAVVADGCRGLDNLARKRGWKFQWCHAHMKRKVFELRGFRKLPGKEIRQRVTALIYTFLQAPTEDEANRCVDELSRLMKHPDAPRSLWKRLKAVAQKPHVFRTYRSVPEFNLPVTTNSVEQVNEQFRRILRQIRGVRTIRSLRFWIRIISRTIQPISCRGYQQTIKKHRKFYRNSMS